jgi:nitrate reductase gamma subunit
LALRAGRHLVLHLGGAFAAVAIACAVPAFCAFLLGKQWPLLLPVVAIAPVVLLVAFFLKVARWMRAPVPFRIPLTVGQQHSLPSIPHAPVGNPRSFFQVVLRVLLDVLLFRPLFRTTPTAPLYGRGLAHGMNRSLWLLALAFHGALALILLRHLRFFLEPVPGFVVFLEKYDVATEMVLPAVHVTSLLLPFALAFLIGRRLVLARMRYISLAADYFPLLLLFAIATTGIIMRHFTRTDVMAVKQFTLGLAHGALVLPANRDIVLVMHVFLVGILVAYYPTSKLMHMPGVLMSPTLTMANINRERRHINVRNPKVEMLHYADYENTFRARMIEAGLPVEKDVQKET